MQDIRSEVISVRSNDEFSVGLSLHSRSGRCIEKDGRGRHASPPARRSAFERRGRGGRPLRRRAALYYRSLAATARSLSAPEDITRTYVECLRRRFYGEERKGGAARSDDNADASSVR